MAAIATRVLLRLLQISATLQGAFAAIGIRRAISQDKKVQVTLERKSNGTLQPSIWLRPTLVQPEPETFSGKDRANIAREAPLNEEGYLTVAKLENNADMTIFVRRLAKHLNLYVRDQGALAGMVPHFSGVRGYQTFFALKQELLATAAIPHTWLVEDDSRHSSYVTKFTKSFVGSYLWDGRTAPLNNVGYLAIARLKDKVQMVQFVRRVVEDMGLYVSDEGKLNGFVKYYSGSQGVQNFAKLRYELIGAVRDLESWLSSGESVVLNEVGYRSVAALRNDTQMAVFIKRVAAHHGCSVTNNGGLMGVVPHFSGTMDVQSLALLEVEVRKSCGLTGSEANYGNIHNVVGKDGVLQIRLDGSTRYKYSADALQSAGIVPSHFPGTDAKTATSHQLDTACYPNTDKETLIRCKRKEVNLGAEIGLASLPGCRSKTEQAITDSHKQALEYAYGRDDAEWTAIVEDDVVPLHAGLFDDSFAEAWAKLPSEIKMVRLSWCTFEQDLGSIRKKTFINAGNFRLVKWMSWEDGGSNSHYYTGGCTTGYIVHQSLLPELLSIFPCCCPIDCCLERQLFYAPPREHNGATFRGEEILMNLDAWDSREDSFNFTHFNQGGVLVQDNRELASTRPEWVH